jgi:hypothetical protein
MAVLSAHVLSLSGVTLAVVQYGLSATLNRETRNLGMRLGNTEKYLHPAQVSLLNVHNLEVSI